MLLARQELNLTICDNPESDAIDRVLTRVPNGENFLRHGERKGEATFTESH